MNLKANVVYEFTCSCDRNLSYIGKTKRHLATRSSEHFNKKSAIFDHLTVCKICNDEKSLHNFQILDTANNDCLLQIKEALYIKRRKPQLNNQIFQNGASFLLDIF